MSSVASTTSSPSIINEEAREEIAANARVHFKVVHFIMESGLKLHLQAISLATAATLYHSFFKECNVEEYDPYLIATTAIYLAGKIEEQHIKLRDIINICYRTLHKGKPILDIGKEFWRLRDSVVNTELLLLRMLKFRVVFEHPHKYLLHYITSLSDWIGTDILNRIPVAQTAWSLLRDSYHGDICLRYKPQFMAVSVLYLALQCHGVNVPYNATAETRWWEALCDTLNIDIIKKIVTELIELYNIENTVGG